MRITSGSSSPPVTVHYPHEALKMWRYRCHIVPRDQETGKSVCIACKSCEKACPSDCIVVEGIKREGEKKKSVTDFKLDFTVQPAGLRGSLPGGRAGVLEPTTWPARAKNVLPDRLVKRVEVPTARSRNGLRVAFVLPAGGHGGGL
jgi:ferredoxin